MVWSLGLCPDDAKKDPVMYGAESGVVFLAKGPRTASIQDGFDRPESVPQRFLQTEISKF